MSESSQAPRSLKDPVRIVYHAGNRTFARLFNEHSLDEIKDVVRRKLALGVGTDVSLKQMGSGTLLDLDDDGDFQAFRVHLKSSVSADIQVVVGPSQGSALPPPVVPQPRDGLSVSTPITTTLVASSSREPAGATTFNQLDVQAAVAPIAEVSTSPTETPSTRKRKVSSGHGGVAVSDKPVEQRSDQPTAHPKVTHTAEVFSARKARPPSPRVDAAAIPDKTMEQRPLTHPLTVASVVSAKAAECPRTSEPGGIEEPPKKKQKKEHPKKKQVQATESVADKPSKLKLKVKSTTLDRGSKVDAKVPGDSEISEPLVKRRMKTKKDVTIGKKKSSTSLYKDGMDQPISQPSSLVDKAARQTGSSAEDETSDIHKSERTVVPKGTVCASIPQTSASTSVRSEVAAAILSGYLSKASETVPSEPPAKRRSVRRVTRSFASSSALPTESTPASDALANETSNLPAEHKPEQEVPTNRPPQRTLDMNVPSCPICLAEPFHIRYCCPTVLKGPDAIRERLKELKRTNMGNQQSLIKQLEGLLGNSKEPSLDITPTDDVESDKVSSQPSASLPRTPNIPSNSYLAEVTVESKDEGSSSESSDGKSEGGIEHQELSASQRLTTPDEPPLSSDDDLDAIIRGPKWNSLLNSLGRILENEDDESSSSENEAELEEDLDEEIDPLERRLSRQTIHSSISESEEEESRSPSPSHSNRDVSNILGPSVQSSNNPTKESAEYPEGDVVMANSVDPPVLEGQDDDSNDETHVESEDRMAVDKLPGENGAAIVAQEQSPSPVPRTPVLQPLDPPSNETLKSANTQAESPPNGNAGILLSSEVPKEVEIDPIEPADDMAPPTVSHSTNGDPIEAPPEDFGSLFPNATQSTPLSGVSKRIKTRNGQVLDDEADRPVLLERLAPDATDELTPIPVMGKLRRMMTGTPASQQPVLTRKSPRFSSVPPVTSTSAAVVLLNHRTKFGKATKTPAKQSERRSDASKKSSKDDAAQDESHVTSALSFVSWETLAEPSSPSVQQDEPPVLVDELMSGSPQPDDSPICGPSDEKGKKGRFHKSAAPSQTENSQEKERLFDFTPSQIPFPYSQKRINLAPTPLLNGKESEGTTDSEDEPKVAKKKTKVPVRYRPLSQLASQAFFSPSLPTPSNKSTMNARAKKRAAEEDSSSSSSSDEDEADGSEHIPRGRRAGSVLEIKKRKGLLSRI